MSQTFSFHGYVCGWLNDLFQIEIQNEKGQYKGCSPQKGKIIF